MKKIAIFLLLIAGVRAYAQDGLSDLACSFVQTRHTEMLEHDAVSRGRMYFSFPDKVRWEYVSVSGHAFVMNGNKAWSVSDSKVRELDPSNAGMFSGMSEIMLAGAAGEGTDIFEVIKDGDRMTMVPRKRDMKRLFSKVELVFRGSLPVSVKIYEQNGDFTLIEFSDHDTGPIPAEVFDVL